MDGKSNRHQRSIICAIFMEVQGRLISIHERFDLARIRVVGCRARAFNESPMTMGQQMSILAHDKIVGSFHVAGLALAVSV